MNSDSETALGTDLALLRPAAQPSAVDLLPPFGAILQERQGVKP
jgi:hypothetical protein